MINEIEEKVRECNNIIGKENEFLLKIKNYDSSLNSLNKHHKKLNSTSEKCVEIIKSYNEFAQNNKNYIESIKAYFNNQWKEMEAKWREWNYYHIGK